MARPVRPWLAFGLLANFAACERASVQPSDGTARIVRFEATPSRIRAGEPVRLSWATEGATGAILSPGVGLVAARDSIELRPLRSTTYTLTVLNRREEIASQVAVMVSDGPPRVDAFTAVPQTIRPGETARLEWATSGASEVELSPDLGRQALNGSIEVRPTENTEYRVVATGPGGRAERAFQLVVEQAQAPVIRRFAGLPAAIGPGERSTLSWEVEDADVVSISGVPGSFEAVGEVLISPAQSTIYTLVARGPAGQSERSLPINVTESSEPRIRRFEAIPPNASVGDSVELRWNTESADRVRIEPGFGEKPPKGSLRFTLTTTTTVVLETVGGGGDPMQQALVVGATKEPRPQVLSFRAEPARVRPGHTTTLRWSTRGADLVDLEPGIARGLPPNGTHRLTLEQAQVVRLVAHRGAISSERALRLRPSDSPLGGSERCGANTRLSQSGFLRGDTRLAVDDYSTVAACTGYAQSGPDVVYTVELNAGDRVAAELAHDPSDAPWDGALYLLTSCERPEQACVAGSDDGGDERLDFTALTSGVHYLVVDSFDETGGAFELKLDLSQGAPPNDTCGEAKDLGTGGQISGSTAFATADVSPAAGACSAGNTDGSDLFYRVALRGGQTLNATLDATFPGTTYLIDACEETLCLSSAAGRTLRFTAPREGAYFLVVDGPAGHEGPFALDVAIDTPLPAGDACQDALAVESGIFTSAAPLASPIGSDTETCLGGKANGPERAYRLDAKLGEVIELRAQFPDHDGALYLTDRCDASGSCVGGADSATERTEQLRHVARADEALFLIAGSLRGETGPHELTVRRNGGARCEDAPALLTTGEAEWFTTEPNQNLYSPEASTCTGYAETGPERVYAVDLDAGAQLWARAEPESSGYDLSLYLSGSCADLPGACVNGIDASSNGPEELAAIVDRAGTYFLVIDGYGGSKGTGTLSAQVLSGESCAEAYLVPEQGGVFRATLAGYDDALELAHRESCAAESSRADAVYRLNLRAGADLSVSLFSTSPKSMYLMKTCDPEAGCEARAQAGGALRYHAAQAETLYLVVEGAAEPVEQAGYRVEIQID